MGPLGERLSMMRLPAQAAYPLQIVLLTGCMAVVMSSALTLIRGGLTDAWMVTSLRNAATAYPIALASSFLIGPVIRRLVMAITRAPTQSRREPHCRDC
jgi:hypothetical protein